MTVVSISRLFNLLLQRNSLYRAVRFANFGFFCSVNHLSGPPRKHVYLNELERSWFVIRDWWVSIRFVCFRFQGLLPCDRSVSGNNNRLVKFASQIFLIFLSLVICENKATSASVLRQKIHPPLRFPSLFLSSLVICINPAFTKLIDGTEKPQRDTTDFAVKGPLKNFPFYFIRQYVIHFKTARLILWSLIYYE